MYSNFTNQNPNQEIYQSQAVVNNNNNNSQLEQSMNQSRTNILFRNLEKNQPIPQPKKQAIDDFQAIDQNQIRSKFPGRAVAQETSGQTSVFKRDHVDEARLVESVYSQAYFRNYYFGEKTFKEVVQIVLVQSVLMVVMMLAIQQLPPLQQKQVNYVTIVGRLLMCYVLISTLDYQLGQGCMLILHVDRHAESSRHKGSQDKWYGRMLGCIQVIMGVFNILVAYGIMMRHQEYITLIVYYITSLMVGHIDRLLIYTLPRV